MRWTWFATGLMGLAVLGSAALAGGGDTRVAAHASEDSMIDSPLVALPNGFVDVVARIPDLEVDLRYLGSDNFVGRPIPGYEAERVILTAAAAAALAKVQEELRPMGLGLLVYDAYRPERAVAAFVRWAEDLEDQAMKEQFYPDVAKESLFREGYIASRSSHSRGSTVDLTIVARGEEGVSPLDMGTPFDFFSHLSWPDNRAVSPQDRANRLLLQSLMKKHGFEPYPKEWWHFTLRDEPFPEKAFDFPIR